MERFNRVHEEIRAQARKLDRSIGALGARWGLQSEPAFRQALAVILEPSFGIEAIHVNEYYATLAWHPGSAGVPFAGGPEK